MLDYHCQSYSILRDRTFARISDEDWGTVVNLSNHHIPIVVQILYSVYMSGVPSWSPGQHGLT